MIKRRTKRKLLVLGLVFIFAFLIVISSSNAVFGWRWGAGWPPPINYLFGR